jgi:NTE family protein
LVGLLPFQSSAKRVAAAYRRALFGDATLQSLPNEPRFVFNATNLMSAGLMRFSRSYIADYRVGEIKQPNFQLADVVAASSAFPPVLSPFAMDFRAQPMTPFVNSVLGRPPYTQRAVLTDGGVYDNLGLETVWKRYRTIIVSNAGRNVAAEKRPWHSWPFQLYRVTNVIFNQVDNARERQLLSLARTGHRKVAYWTIETNPASFGSDCALSMTPAECARSSAISTRLTSLSVEDCTLLVKHGYLLADLTMRRYLDLALPVPSGFPDLKGLF